MNIYFKVRSLKYLSEVKAKCLEIIYNDPVPVDEPSTLSVFIFCMYFLFIMISLIILIYTLHMFVHMCKREHAQADNIDGLRLCKCYVSDQGEVVTYAYFHFVVIL